MSWSPAPDLALRKHSFLGSLARSEQSMTCDARDSEDMKTPVAEALGPDMKSTTTVKREMERMLNEYADALESLLNVAGSE
jgi:hypothetical protein